MRNLLSKFRLAVLGVVLCGIFSGCGKEGYGEFSVSVKEAGNDFVSLFITAPSSLEMAYQISKEPMLTTPAVLFKTGTVITVNPADVIEITDDIEQDTKYYFYAVAKVDDQNYSPLISLEFTTKKYEFTELLTLVKPYPDGFKVHITVPQATKDRGNVIRYGSTSLAWYNLLKSRNGSEVVDVNAVVANGNPYGNYVKNDSTIVFNDMNVVLLDENGQLNVDDEILEIMTLLFPKKFLCSEDCPGLCPTCGKPKREGNCGCPDKEIDPRLAVLKKLLDNSEK